MLETFSAHCLDTQLSVYYRSMVWILCPYVLTQTQGDLQQYCEPNGYL